MEHRAFERARAGEVTRISAFSGSSVDGGLQLDAITFAAVEAKKL
jgi:hypothetical protein